MWKWYLAPWILELMASCFENVYRIVKNWNQTNITANQSTFYIGLGKDL